MEFCFTCSQCLASNSHCDASEYLVFVSLWGAVSKVAYVCLFRFDYLRKPIWVWDDKQRNYCSTSVTCIACVLSSSQCNITPVTFRESEQLMCRKCDKKNPAFYCRNAILQSRYFCNGKMKYIQEHLTYQMPTEMLQWSASKAFLSSHLWLLWDRFAVNILLRLNHHMHWEVSASIINLIQKRQTTHQ